LHHIFIIFVAIISFCTKHVLVKTANLSSRPGNVIRFQINIVDFNNTLSHFGFIADTLEQSKAYILCMCLYRSTKHRQIHNTNKGMESLVNLASLVIADTDF
jgi:hypothetical protein